MNPPTQLLSSGTCGCLGYDLIRRDDYKTVMGKLAYMSFFLGGFSDDIQRQMAEIICSGVLNYGETRTGDYYGGITATTNSFFVLEAISGKRPIFGTVSGNISLPLLLEIRDLAFFVRARSKPFSAL